MAVSISSKSYNTTINVPSNEWIEFSSTNSSQPNFFLKCDVTVLGQTFYDGATTRSFYLYPNPSTGKMRLYLDWIASTMKDRFMHNLAPPPPPFPSVVTLSNNSVQSNIRIANIMVYEYYGNPPIQQGVGTAFNTNYVIYSNVFKGSFNSYVPQVNNKVWRHPNVKIVFKMYKSLGNSVTLNQGGSLQIIYSHPGGAPANEDNLFINQVYFSGWATEDLLIYENEELGTILYQVVPICNNEGIMMYYVNNRGGLEHFYFPTYNLNRSNIKRNSIITEVEQQVALPFTQLYTSAKSFGGGGIDTITAETGIIDEGDSVALASLVTSPFIYFHFLNEPGIYYTASLKETNFQLPNYRKNKYTTRQFTFNYALIKF